MLYSPIVRRFCGGKPSFQCFSFHPLLHSFGLSFKVGPTEDQDVEKHVYSGTNHSAFTRGKQGGEREGRRLEGVRGFVRVSTKVRGTCVQRCQPQCLYKGKEGGGGKRVGGCVVGVSVMRRRE